jgi:hypothetical protein
MLILRSVALLIDENNSTKPGLGATVKLETDTVDTVTEAVGML